MTIKMIDADNNEIIVLDNGYYVVDVNGRKTIAERCGTEWLQLGIDYDVWQYSREDYIVKVVAHIDVDKLKCDII